MAKPKSIASLFHIDRDAKMWNATLACLGIRNPTITVIWY